MQAQAGLVAATSASWSMRAFVVIVDVADRREELHLAEAELGHFLELRQAERLLVVEVCGDAEVHGARSLYRLSNL